VTGSLYCPQAGARLHLPSRGKWKGYIRFNYNILVCPKNQDTFGRLKIYLNCDCRRGSASDQIGGDYSALPAPPGLLAGFKGAALQLTEEGRVERAGMKGRGGGK